MTRLKSKLKTAAYLILIGGVVFFFVRAFQRNWETVRAHRLELHAPSLTAAALCVLASYLLATRAWQVALNSLATREKMSFATSVAVVNTSSLTKYLPGKLWSYALQMYWLSSSGFSKARVVYVNLLSLYVSIMCSLISGLVFLLFAPGRLTLPMVLGALLLVVAVDVASIQFHKVLFRWLTLLVKRLLKRDLQYFELSGRCLVELHVLQFGAAVTFGAASYLTAVGIGYHVAPAEAAQLFASFLISDIVGFVAILVPGGLGVREAIMYMMLGGERAGSLALTLPLATRTLTMVCDVLLGAVALRLLKGLGAGAAQPDSRDPASDAEGS